MKSNKEIPKFATEDEIRGIINEIFFHYKLQIDVNDVQLGMGDILLRESQAIEIIGEIIKKLSKLSKNIDRDRVVERRYISKFALDSYNKGRLDITDLMEGSNEIIEYGNDIEIEIAICKTGGEE